MRSVVAGDCPVGSIAAARCEDQVRVALARVVACIDTPVAH